MCVRANGTVCFTQVSLVCEWCVCQSFGRGRKQNGSFAGVYMAFFIVRVKHLLRCCCRCRCLLYAMHE